MQYKNITRVRSSLALRDAKQARLLFLCSSIRHAHAPRQSTADSKAEPVFSQGPADDGRLTTHMFVLSGPKMPFHGNTCADFKQE